MSCEARLIEVTKQATCALEHLVDPAAGITVERVYAPDFLSPELWLANPDLANSFTGRRVYVMAVSETHMGPISRAEDDDRYGVGVVTMERYAGDEPVVPTAWMDERLAWVESKVLDFLGDARVRAIKDADPMTQEWLVPYSPDMLRQHKLLR